MCQQFVKLLPAMSLGDWGGTGGGGLVHSKGENSMAVTGLGCENPLGEPFLSFGVQMDLENGHLTL